MADISKPAPARLFVHLAREAPVGVILRRGPTKWVQVILWHTDTDTFEFGQWFHGRIHERVCDVSPDGSIFLYFAVDYSEEIRDAPHTLTFMWKWTAMSRPPYLTALALWPNFDDRYYGGGFFGDSRTVYLYGEETETIPAQGSVPQDMEILRVQALHSEGVEVFSSSSLNGWTLTKPAVRKIPGTTYQEAMIWSKVRSDTRCTILHQVWDIYDSNYNYRFIDSTTRSETEIEGLTWADFDQRGRIVFAREGKLFAIEPTGALDTAQEIADFNDQRFTPVVAPEWAQHW